MVDNDGDVIYGGIKINMCDSVSIVGQTLTYRICYYQGTFLPRRCSMNYKISSSDGFCISRKFDIHTYPVDGRA